MRTRNYMYGQQFANSLSSSCTCICSSLYSAYISSDHYSYQSAAYEFLTDEVYVCSLYHSICSFDRTN